MFAVSKKLIPWSSALCMMRVDAAASVCPPNIIVPRHTGETFTPAKPRLRYCMVYSHGTTRLEQRLSATNSFGFNAVRSMLFQTAEDAKNAEACDYLHL